MNKVFEGEESAEVLMARRKPRLMVAGEFSAGKSRLINGLLGEEVLPSNVTSTALPPIWLVGRGTESFCVGHDGSTTELDLNRVNVETTAFCVLSVDAPILEHVDLIDTPGSSDPNMPPESWERMVRYADGMIWCTNAAQAWKQSEKATIADLPEDLHAQALLVITQADRMPDERSASRVQRRVRRDAGPFFTDVMMGSMLRSEDVEALATRVIALAGAMVPRGTDEPIVERIRPAQPIVMPTLGAMRDMPLAQAEDQSEEIVGEVFETALDNPSESTDAELPAAEPEAESAPCEDTSFGLQNGTVARLWDDLSRDADLTNNEVYLERVAALLTDVKALLSRQDDTSAAATTDAG